MKEIINIYKQHKTAINEYIHTLIANLPKEYIENADMILKNNDAIQLIYAVDSDFKQISPVICKKEHDSTNINSDKSHYFNKLDLDRNNIYTSNPYIHYRTGNASLSTVVLVDQTYYVFDFNLMSLLKNLNLVEHNLIHEKVKKVIYGLGSVLLTIISLALIIYGGYTFFAFLFTSEDFELLQHIFESIISITLGLAIFDFAKQLFEHEVLFSGFNHTENKQYKILGKFLVSVIIALSIETLMVVFKVALKDYTQMLSAFYLILGTTIMLLGLAFYSKIINKLD
jgi:hypothetical protein